MSEQFDKLIEWLKKQLYQTLSRPYEPLDIYGEEHNRRRRELLLQFLQRVESLRDDCVSPRNEGAGDSGEREK